MIQRTFIFAFMKILLIDNYDSFTFNLVHYFEKLSCDVTVCRNDEWTQSIGEFDKIVLSPGPGLPKEAGKLFEIIDFYHQAKPILGICLGMQAITEFFGGEIYNQTKVKHGVQEKIFVDESMLFNDLEKEQFVGLYHSWACDISRTNQLKATSFSKTKVLMSIEHFQLPVVGVQFHPESILTENGLVILRNFIEFY